MGLRRVVPRCWNEALHGARCRFSSTARPPAPPPEVAAPPSAPTPASTTAHRMARPLAGAASTVPLRRRIDRCPVAVERPEHHRPDGTFQNPWSSYTEYGPMDYFTGGVLSLRKLETYALPLTPVAWAGVAAPADPLQALWVGHATFLVQLSGWNFLTDPMFSRRASPVQWVGPARYTPAACSVDDLPPLHFVLLSHSHYDHLDTHSVRAILAKEKRDLLAPHPRGAGSRRFTGTLWCVPLRLKALLERFGVPEDQIVELDWWDAFTPALHDAGVGAGAAALPLPQTSVPNALAGVVQRGWRRDADAAAAAELHPAAPTVVCVPAQHHSARTPFDRNNTLWGGFVVLAPQQQAAATAAATAPAAARASALPPLSPADSGPQQTDTAAPPHLPPHLRFYFSGDTGYRSVPKGTEPNSAAEASATVCPAFRDVGALYGPLDLSLLPIGAYSPRWFMSSFHCTPEDAVEMHTALLSRRSVAMHWGTFPLTDECIEEPPVRLAAAAEARGLPRDEFVAVRAGSLVSAARGALPGGAADVVESRTPAGDAIAAAEAVVAPKRAEAASALTIWERLRAYL